MKFALAAIVVCLCASLPARADQHVARDAAEYSIFAVSELTYAIDMLQTLDIKNHVGHEESNPLLGKHPADARVVGYFAGCMALNAAVFALLPPKYRSVLPSVIVVYESSAINSNRAHGIGLQMPRMAF